MSHLIVVLLVISQQICDAKILYKLEGEDAKLDFPYPCDSTEITLQHGNGRPFYRSANPEHIALPSRYKFANRIESNSDICYLNLTINPVSRDDEGTFILMAYKDGQMLHDLARIGLRVDYPPGKAFCESSDAYIEGEWIRLQCLAPVGNLAGQAVCYQNGMRLPPLTSPRENGGKLNQIILARLDGLVYCCTSTFQQTKDRCECNDFRWNPVQDTELSNITNPCTAAIQTAKDPTTPVIQQDLQKNSTINPTPPDSRKGRNTSTSNYWLYAFLISMSLLVLSCTALIHFIKKAWKLRKHIKKQFNAII